MPELNRETFDRLGRLSTISDCVQSEGLSISRTAAVILTVGMPGFPLAVTLFGNP